MRARLLITFLFFAFAARGLEREVARAFPVKSGAQLNVEFFRGAITVDESDGREINVAAHLEMKTESAAVADRLEAALHLEISADGNTVNVRAGDPVGRGVHLSLDDDPPVDVDLRIVVPRECSVNLTTRDGSITVGNLAGRIVARTTTGNIFLKRIEGSIDARAQAGDVTISRCSGEVAASTAKGSIRVGTVGGRAELKNTNGDIEVLAARGGLEATADAGDVTVGFPRGVAGDANVRTGFGNVLAKIDPAANCLVDASSFWGHVQNTLPLTIESGGNGKGKLVGRLNRGGARLTFSANGGHVKIEPGETPFN